MIVLGALGMPGFVRSQMFPFIRAKMRLQIAIENWIILSVYLSLFYLAFNGYPGFFGIFLGQVVGHCMLSTYLVMEHHGLPHEGTILEKTRSIRVNQFVKLVMWNMPYHAEHHAFPAVPFHALPLLHKEIEDEILHKTESPADFHLKVVKDLGASKL